jgi:hypothetical protein
MSDLRPTAGESASVEHAGRLLHRQGWSRVFTPNEMADSWAGLIDQVEEGYRLCVDEYTNDLACRDWLAQAWPLFTERVRAARGGRQEGRAWEAERRRAFVAAR